MWWYIGAITHCRCMCSPFDRRFRYSPVYWQVEKRTIANVTLCLRAHTFSVTDFVGWTSTESRWRAEECQDACSFGEIVTCVAYGAAPAGWKRSADATGSWPYTPPPAATTVPSPSVVNVWP